MNQPLLKPATRTERPRFVPDYAAAGAPLNEPEVPLSSPSPAAAVAAIEIMEVAAAADPPAVTPEQRNEILDEFLREQAILEEMKRDATAAAAEIMAKRDRLRAAAFEGVMEARRVAGRQDGPITTLDVSIGYNVADLYCVAAGLEGQIKATAAPRAEVAAKALPGVIETAIATTKP